MVARVFTQRRRAAKKNFVIRTLVASLLFCFGLSAQVSTFVGPQPGFLFDAPTNAIRRIVGSPGSAYLGSSALDSLDMGFVSPSNNRALVSVQGQSFAVSNLGSDGPQLTPVDLPLGASAVVAWSGDASVAAVAVASDGSIRVVRWTDGSPAIGDPLDISMLGSASALAMDRTGKLLLVAVPGDAGGIYRIQPDAPPVLLASLSGPSAIAISSDARFAYAADSASGQIFEISSPGDNPSARIIFGQQDGLGNPVGLALSSDKKTLHVADQQLQALLSYDLADGLGLVSKTALESSSEALQPISQTTLYLIAGRAKVGDTVWVLDADAAQVYFLPAGSAQ